MRLEQALAELDAAISKLVNRKESGQDRRSQEESEDPNHDNDRALMGDRWDR